MFSFESSGSRLCDGVPRREFLRVGGLSLFGLGVADLLRAAASPVVVPSSILNPQSPINCILLWMMGGPSQVDTFDMKPDAPAEIRGEYKPISTCVPGVQICEHLPNLARRMDKVALIRSITHSDATHGSASHAMFTGVMKPGAAEGSTGFEYPHYGSVLTKLSEGSLGSPVPRGLPAAVTLPYYLRDRPVPVTGQGAGYLGKEHDPFFMLADPNEASFAVPNLTPPPGLDAVRVERRRTMLQCFDDKLRALEQTDRLRSHDAYYQKAYAMLSSPAAKKAFAISQESAQTRDRYGRTTFGQSCLLARRLVEGGARFVTVNFVNDPGNFENSFDTHGENFRKLKSVLLPRLEPAYCALLDDLHASGLIHNTLVVLMGEFGRTPKISGSGRDHWPGVFFALFAGAGVRGGQVIGESDAQGAYPKSRAISPADIGTTIYRTLGVPAHTEFIAPDGRPLRVMTGEVISELFA